MSGQPLLSRFFRPVGKTAAADRPAAATAPAHTHAHTHPNTFTAPHAQHARHTTSGHDTVDLTLDDEIPASPATRAPTTRQAPPAAAPHPSPVHLPSTLTHTRAAGTHARIHGQGRVAASAGAALANERAAIVAALTDDVPEAVSAYQEAEYLLLGDGGNAIRAGADADAGPADAQARGSAGARRDTNTQARGGRAGGKRGVAAEAGPALTALEKQVLELKSQCPHAVLLVQAGYKYRCFGRDASVLSRVAHVWAYKPRARVLTTASIPTHRIGVHVRRLVASGYAAAVAVQSEGAASKAAGMGVAARYRTFARHIARVYTPATIDDDALIGESAVERSRDGVGADDAEMAVVVQAATDANVQSCVCICRPILRKAIVYTWSHAATTAHDDFQAVWQRILRQHSVREVVVPATVAEPGKRDLLASVAPQTWERLRSAAIEVCSTGSYVHAAASSIVPERVTLDDRRKGDPAPRAARCDDVVADEHATVRPCCTRLQLRSTAELLTTGEELLTSRDEPAPSATNEEAADEEDEDDAMDEPSADIDSEPEAGGLRKRGRLAAAPAAADSAVPEAIEPSDSAAGLAAAYRLEVIATIDRELSQAGEAVGDVPSVLVRRALVAAKTYERALRSPQTATTAERTTAANESTDAPYSVTAGRIIGANDARSSADCILMDDITMEDLQVLRAIDSDSEGSLLHVLHQGGGPMGRRVLHDWLAYPLKRREVIMERQQGVAALAAAIKGAYADGCPCAPCAALAMQAYKDHGRADIDAWLQRIAAGGATPQHVVRLMDVLAAVADAARNVGDAVTARSCAAGRLVHEYAQTLMTGGAPRALKAELESSLDIDVVRRGMHKGRSAATTTREPAPPGGVPSNIPFRVESPHVRASFPQIGRWWDALQAANTALESELEHARALLRKPGLEWTTHRTGPTSVTECLIELRRAELESPLAPLHVPEDWVEINATKAVRRYHTPGAQSGLEKRALAREMLAAAADAAWKTWCERIIARCGPDLSGFAHAISQLDALSCLARVASLPGWVAPTLISEGQPYIHIRAGRHPMVEAAMQLRGSGPYVPSDIELSSSAGRVMVLTGPNAGGKSTTVRMAALCVLLAHIGSFVPADSAKLSTFDVIATRMGASDAIVQGRSTFRVEMDETARILSAIEACRSGRVLAVFDELGRGTATFDGCALALATLKHVLVRCPYVAGVFITHYPQLNRAHELVPVGRVGDAPPSLQYMHMAFVEEPISEPRHGTADDAAPEEGETRLTLLYHLKAGAAPKSYGLRVAALAGMPASVLRVAHAVVAESAHRPVPASHL